MIENLGKIIRKQLSPHIRYAIPRGNGEGVYVGGCLVGGDVGGTPV